MTNRTVNMTSLLIIEMITLGWNKSTLPCHLLCVVDQGAFESGEL